MDIIDLWWNASQQAEISELRTSLSATRVSSSTTIARQAQLIGLMQQENDELRLRVGVLIRLLIQQGTISADQYSAAVTEAKASIALGQVQAAATNRPKPPKLHPSKPR